MSNIGKVALRKKAEPEAEPLVYVLVFEKRNGGIVCSQGRAPKSAVVVEKAHPPDALDFAIGWGTSRLEEDMQRGKI